MQLKKERKKHAKNENNDKEKPATKQRCPSSSVNTCVSTNM